MKTRIIVLIITLSSITTFGQKLELEKASPFTAVKWEKDLPIVKFDNEWYYFDKLDTFDKHQILNYCKKQYGTKWQKRFSEDLVEVLQGLSYTPNKEANLVLSKDGKVETYIGTFTFENRQSCLIYNRMHKAFKPSSVSKKQVKTTLSKKETIQDLKQFKEILDTRSSYTQLSTFDYEAAIKKVSASILKTNGDISIDKLTNEISKIMAEIGDRHSSIKNEDFDKKDHFKYELKLPFGITVLDNKLVAVKQTSKKDNYIYYFEDYPCIKSINDIDVKALLNTYNYRDKKAPKEAKLTRGANAIQKFGALLFKNNKQCPDFIQVVFTDGKNDKTESFELTIDKKGYVSNLSVENFNSMMRVSNTGQFDSLSKLLGNNIGYIKIPRMFHYKQADGLEQFFENSIQEFSNTKALIIDIRNNPGGGREILQTFADYIVQPEQSPWVANVAYLRTNKPITADESSMRSRYLYTYNSEKLSNKDRDAIDVFNRDFKTQRTFDHSKFSSPFYMVLDSGKTPYAKPIYILANENSFSAATVFTTAFKGLPNVKIVGVTTDGSSGNSIIIHLKNSNIRIKVSTMLSFQRNGKTLDGNGTEPDIYIPIDQKQIFTGIDTQLEKLVGLLIK